MAEHAHNAHPESSSHGAMDIRSHQQTYRGFIAGAKWGTILVIAIVVFMFVFRSHNG